jgi:hypothetical protein
VCVLCVLCVCACVFVCVCVCVCKCVCWRAEENRRSSFKGVARRQILKSVHQEGAANTTWVGACETSATRAPTSLQQRIHIPHAHITSHHTPPPARTHAHAQQQRRLTCSFGNSVLMCLTVSNAGSSTGSSDCCVDERGAGEEPDVQTRRGKSAHTMQ